MTEEEIQKLIEENRELRTENHNLKEKLESFIPRRRVRRIFKQVKKILEQDGITDDLDLDD